MRNTLQLSLVNIVLDYNPEVDEGIYLWSLLSNDVLNSPDEAFKTHFYNLSKTQLKELINKNVEGYTLLEVAAYAGNTNAIEQLVQEGASPNVGNSVYRAASMNQIKAIELLKNNDANIEHQEEDKGYTPLHIACEEGYLNCVSLLLKLGASNSILNYAGYRPSTLAIAKGHIDILELMLEREVNIYSLDSKNNVLLAASGADENECEMIELLCTRKAADINEQDQDGTTALTNAVMLEKVSLVEYLLSHEANANIPLNDGYTAYQLAEEKNNIELMKMLGQLDIEALD